MLKWVKKQLSSEQLEFETDRRLVLIVLSISLLATILFFVSNISQELVSILGVALLFAFFLALRGHLEIAGLFGPLSGLVIISLLLFRNYGIRDTAVLGLPVVIVAASLMNGQKGAILFGIASLLVVIGLGLSEAAGLVINDFSPHNTLSDYLVVCVVIMTTVAMQWAVLKRLMENVRLKNRELSERLRAEEEKTAYAQELEVLYQLSLEMSELAPDKSLDEFLTQRLKELTQAFFVSLAKYNPLEKRMETRQLVVESQILNQAIQILGVDPRSMYLPVSDETYQEIVREVVGYRKTLSEATFGVISPMIGLSLQTFFNLDSFVGLAILYNGELEATLVIAWQKGVATPSQRFFQALANLSSVAFWRKKAEQARLESETRFQQMADLLPQGIFECDQNGFITYANQQAGLLLGSTGFTPGDHFVELFEDEKKAQMQDTFKQIMAGLPVERSECQISRMNGSRFPALVYTSLIVRNGHNWGMRGVFVDITELKQAERALQRTNRYLRATSRCNMALVHAESRNHLFNEICLTLVEEAGYSFAWIGLYDENNSTGINPVAYAGIADIQLNAITTRCGQLPLDCAPMLNAIHTLKPILVNDICSSHNCQVCEEEAAAKHLKSMISVPIIYADKVYGGIAVYTSFQDHFSPDEIKVLEEMSSDLAFGLHTLQVRTDRDHAIVRLEEVNQQLSEAYDVTLEGMSQLLELRERETAGHSQRVVRLVIQLAEKIGVPPDQLSNIRRGAILHDIGKIGIPDSILLKPNKLTDEEWVIMRQHPVYAYRLISSIPFLNGATDIPYLHHERWNGSGYPFGLKGEAIPLPARIFAVVDIWDALTYARSYRPAWPEDEARKYLLESAGILLDPKIVSAFLELMELQA